MTTITQNIDDIAGVDDNTSWTFYTQQIRESDSGAAIVSTKKVRKYPVAGVLTVVLDPGPAVVYAADGKTYPFTVPDADTTLWPLIQAAVTIPPSTTHQQLLDAVDAWLASHTAVWANIPDIPAPLLAGPNVANGYAGLDGAGKVAAAQLPSYVDDVLEVANYAALPGTGETGKIYVTLDTNRSYRWSGSVYIETDPAGYAPTAVKTAAYTPAHGDLVITDAASGAITHPLPSAPRDGFRVAFKRIDPPPNLFAVTIACAGSDVFNKSGGGTTLTLPLQNQAAVLQYKASGAIWYVVSTDVPLAQTDTRYRGTVSTGVKGGKTTVLRRRDIRRADVLSPWYGQITATVAAGFASTISSAQSYAMSATPTWCTPVNGATFTSNPLSSASFMLNWRSPNGGSAAATTYPWPTATGIEFELDTASTQAFEVYFRCASPSATTFFYELWIDGQRVWDLPQTASVTANSSTLIKFSGLPTGVHRYRVVLNNCSIYTLFTPQYTIPVKPPARGPRIFFLGDSLMSVGANSGTSGMHTGIESGAWPWRFAEMVGCDDLWQGGIGSTGFIATAGGRTVTDGAMTNGSNILTSATAVFVTGDAGAPPANACQVVGAGPGGSVLSALITSRTDATHVVLDTNASTTVTNAWTRIGGSAANFVIRAITDVVPAAPDIVIMGGWHNDASSGATLIADAYNRAITTIQAALPNAMIIPFGAWDSAGTGGSTYTTIDAAVLAVCTAHGVPYIETGNNGDVYDGAGNIVATQGKWIDTNTKNIYTCSDNTHETDAGMTYIAHRMCQAIYALLPA